MKAIAWAIIIASLHIMPVPTSTAPLAFLGVYIVSWAGFIVSLWSEK